jgi:hypothetical protein
MVAKDNGISVRETARLALRATSISSVMSNASAATLLITADSAAPATAMMEMCVGTARSGATMKRAINSTAPEFTRPRETIRTSAMITTAG